MCHGMALARVLLIMLKVSHQLFTYIGWGKMCRLMSLELFELKIIWLLRLVRS